jgi:hypothetical protein
MSAIPALYCNPCSPGVDFGDSACPDIESGRVRHLLLLQKCITVNDISDAAEWLEKIALGYAARIYGRGSYTSTPVTGPGQGDQTTRTIGRDHALAYTIEGYAGDIQSYNNLSKSNDWEVYFITEKYIRASGVTVSFEITENIDEAIPTLNNILANILWSNIDMPLAVLKPELAY